MLPHFDIADHSLPVNEQGFDVIVLDPATSDSGVNEVALAKNVGRQGQGEA